VLPTSSRAQIKEMSGNGPDRACRMCIMEWGHITGTEQGFKDGT
jgi:hypothetical protein